MSIHTTADGLAVPTCDEVLEAHKRTRPYIHRPPVLTSAFMKELTGAQLFFQCENLRNHQQEP